MYVYIYYLSHSKTPFSSLIKQTLFNNFKVYWLLGRFRRNIALTLMVRLPENFILVSSIIAPRPQNHPSFKSLYIYYYMGGGYVSQFCGCAAGRNVQPIAIKFGTKFSLDVNKNWLVFGDFSPKGVEILKNS